MITLTSGDHLAITIICPDHDHIFRDLQMTVAIQFQNLPIQVRTAHCPRDLLSDHVILFLHDAADETSTFSEVS